MTRFTDLKKIDDQPATRLLSFNNAKLLTNPAFPPAQSIFDVMADLDAEASLLAKLDVLRILAHALPERERIWWAILAGKDMLEDPDKPTGPLEAAEAWVFKPDDVTRTAAIQAAEHADPDDVTAHCASAVQFHDGRLGVDDMQEYEAPAGVAGLHCFLMNMEAVLAKGDPDLQIAHADVLIDRAIHIARGGSGRVEPKAAKSDTETEKETEEG